MATTSCAASLNPMQLSATRNSCCAAILIK
jgi:hypothetical protein